MFTLVTELQPGTRLFPGTFSLMSPRIQTDLPYHRFLSIFEFFMRVVFEFFFFLFVLISSTPNLLNFSVRHLRFIGLRFFAFKYWLLIYHLVVSFEGQKSFPLHHN